MLQIHCAHFSIQLSMESTVWLWPSICLYFTYSNKALFCLSVSRCVTLIPLSLCDVCHPFSKFYILLPLLGFSLSTFRKLTQVCFTVVLQSCCQWTSRLQTKCNWSWRARTWCCSRPEHRISLPWPNSSSRSSSRYFYHWLIYMIHFTILYFDAFQHVPPFIQIQYEVSKMYVKLMWFCVVQPLSARG